MIWLLLELTRFTIMSQQMRIMTNHEICKTPSPVPIINHPLTVISSTFINTRYYLIEAVINAYIISKKHQSTTINPWVYDHLTIIHP